VRVNQRPSSFSASKNANALNSVALALILQRHLVSSPQGMSLLSGV
jgi:hypothetical protein